MPDEPKWISLGEAAKLLGVHPTTVRNWADQGEIPYRRTPGRHRRFDRNVLMEWAAQNKPVSERASTSHDPQVLMEYALGHTRYGMVEHDIHQRDWYEHLSQEAIEGSRKIGRHLLEELLKHLEDTAPEDEELAAAEEIGKDYAKLLQKDGLTLPQAVQGFVYFDDFLVEAVVQMVSPRLSDTPSEWSDLLRQINAFTNKVLVTMITYYLERS